MSNITYVSCLISSPTDHIANTKRLGWLTHLLELDISLVLFVDSTYKNLMPALRESTRLIEIDFQTLETVKLIQAVPNVQLPASRNTGKDTVDFMTIMNSKPELLKLAMPYVETPFVAYLDAGIKKVFKLDGTLKGLETLRVHSIPLVMLPGCHPIQPKPFAKLASQIDWTFCGGFFIVPASAVEEFMQIHLQALGTFLAESKLTWEVNVWTALAPVHRDRIIWFGADHNDTMITAIPGGHKY
jgi:hypothetical protein